MRIISTREFRQEAKAFFELAEKERVCVKRGKNKYVHLVVSDSPDTKLFSADWLKEFFAIPIEYRVDPFDISPSGDLFFADRRNLDRIERALEQVAENESIQIKEKEDLKNFLEKL